MRYPTDGKRLPFEQLSQNDSLFIPVRVVQELVNPNFYCRVNFGINSIFLLVRLSAEIFSKLMFEL